MRVYLKMCDYEWSFLITTNSEEKIDDEIITFSQRLWISTTNKWNSAAELTIKNQVQIYDRNI